MYHLHNVPLEITHGTKLNIGTRVYTHKAIRSYRKLFSFVENVVKRE